MVNSPRLRAQNPPGEGKMKTSFYGLAFIFGLVVAPAAYGNCYLFENRSNSTVKLQFAYNGPVGTGSVTAVELMPNRHYPARGEWCWNTREDQWAKVTVSSAAPVRQSWEGQLIMGNGGPASPSGRYVFLPVSQEDQPPQRGRGGRGQSSFGPSRAR